MNGNKAWLAGVGTAVLTCTSGLAWAQTSVSYGRITAVTMVAQSDQRTQTGGALVGGVIGATAGSGRSGSNRALGGTQTITMVTDQAGKRVGDCVAVERGSFNNLRLVADSKCNPTPARAAPAKPTQADIQQANACVQAKEQLLAAETEDAFDRAERRVRLLCGD